MNVSEGYKNNLSKVLKAEISSRPDRQQMSLSPVYPRIAGLLAALGCGMGCGLYRWTHSHFCNPESR